MLLSAGGEVAECGAEDGRTGRPGTAEEEWHLCDLTSWLLRRKDFMTKLGKGLGNLVDHCGRRC